LPNQARANRLCPAFFQHFLHGQQADIKSTESDHAKIVESLLKALEAVEDTNGLRNIDTLGLWVFSLKIGHRLERLAMSMPSQARFTWSPSACFPYIEIR
jgi:hypothetical protein